MNKKFELTEGYTINRVLNGCWQISEGHDLTGGLDFKDIMKAFHMLAERGFTTFDCADIYTGAEDFIGAFTEELKGSSSYSPSDLQVHTKYVPDLDMLKNVTFEYTEGIIDRSLSKLHRECLDLVQFHWWDYEIPGAVETAYHLVKLQEKGKIRNIGVTNFDTAHLKELVDAGIPVVSCQSQYSLLDKRPDKKLMGYCKENGIRLICYGVLAGGFLAERWIGKNFEKPETRSQVKYMQIIDDTLSWDGYQKLLMLLKEIGAAHGVSISQVAANYILGLDNVAGCMIGIRNSSHVEKNVSIFEFDLTEEERRRISDFTAPYPMVDGEPFELERTPGSKYRSIMKMNLNEES